MFMHDKSTIDKIINSYTITTNIPVMFIDEHKKNPSFFSENYDYSLILEYGELHEINDFLEPLFTQAADKQNNIFTFRTTSCLIYIVVLVNTEQHTRGAYVAGPLVSYFPDKKSSDEIINTMSLPLHKRAKFSTLLKTMPIVSEERLHHLGRLLLALSQSCEQVWYSPIENCGNNKPYLTANSYDFTDDNKVYVENEEYDALYCFCLKLKEKIMQGHVDGIIDLLNDNSGLFWNTKSADENLRSLKNKCLIVCSISSVFALQVNAPYKRIINLLASYSESLSSLKSSQEIILKTTYLLETLTYLVSISNVTNFSLHVKRVMQYIKSHYKEKITLNQLAEYVNLNAVYLSSLIKKETNLSLMENINLIRVEEGKNLLIFTNRSIQEISFALGYNYQNHFNNVFKKFTGMTPLEFRQNFGRNSFDP